MKVIDLVFKFFFSDEIEKDVRKEIFIKKLYLLYATLNGLKSFDDNFKRRSDTVFILGSGASLALVKDSSWLKISRFDVFGVNMSIVHGFPVTLQFWEMLGTTNIDSLFVNNMKHERFKNTKFVINVNHAVNKKFFSKKYKDVLKLKNVYGYAPIGLSLKEPTRSNFEAYYETLRSKTKCTSTIHHCTHIGAAVDFAYLSGYKNIVLVGCDLNGGKYFTELKSESVIYPNTAEYKLCNEYRQEHNTSINESYELAHPTMQQDLMNSKGVVDSITYFDSIGKLYKARGVNLSVLNDDSGLARNLPVFDLNGLQNVN